MREYNIFNIKEIYIVKPLASTHGKGVRILTDSTTVPIKGILENYIYNPHLINRRKYDMRIYVLVTGFRPLKIYIYDNGLIIRYSFNGEFVDCIYNFLSKTIIKEIKKLININANEFDKYCKNIIKKGEIGDSTIRKIKSIEKYTLHSDLLGDFEVVRDENTDIYYYLKKYNFHLA